jgi:SAM-dependent methyltransferase
MEDPRNQTNESFLQKWTIGAGAFLDTTLDENSDIFSWITNRNGFQATSEFSNWLSSRSRILDAGCGNGRITQLLRKYSPATTQILGIDFASHEIAQSNCGSMPNTSFMYADLMGDLSNLGQFDLIYCQEVLHHTVDPKRSFLNLVGLLEPEGEIAIYVYKRKSVIREFSDDFIRNQIEGLTFDQAKEAITQITNFARVVSRMPGTFSFPDIPILGIKADELSLHRFIYNNCFKNFWNEEDRKSVV